MQNNRKAIVRLRTRVGAGILILVIPLLFLLALELGLRLAFPDKLKHVGNSRMKVFHPEYIFALKPNIEKTFVRS